MINRLQAAQYVTDARIVLSNEGITKTYIMERGQMSKYLIQSGNLTLKRCFVSGFHVNFLQLIPIQTVGIEAYSLFSGYGTGHMRVNVLGLQPTAIKEEFNYQNA